MNSKKIIIVIDDDEIVGSTLAQGLTDYDAFWVSNIEDAEKNLNNHKISLIIIDIFLNQQNGLDFIKSLKQKIPFIIITGLPIKQYIEEANNLGAIAILEKPFSFSEIRSILKTYFENEHRINSVEQEKSLLLKTNTELYQQVINHVVENERAYVEMIKSLVNALDARDKYTHEHSRGVSYLSSKLSKIINLSDEERMNIVEASLVHDIGKIGISESILLKPGKLTDEEFSIMKEHCAIGANILSPVNHFKEIIPLVYSHHERFDGSGYPSGMKGNDIPIGARIITICDVWNALTTNRPYRGKLADEIAREILEEQKNKQFDPDILNSFLNDLLK